MSINYDLVNPDKKVNFHNQIYNAGPLSSSKLATTPEEELFQFMLFDNQPDKNLIKGYNYFIDKIVENIFIGEYSITGTNGTIIKKYVTKIIIDYPKLTKNNMLEMLTPQMAKTLKVSYTNSIYLTVCDIVFKPDGTNDYINPINKYIGSIPCMVGSNRCYLSTKPKEFSSIEDWKMYCCESPMTREGYFINRGMKKVLINQEKIRTCIYMTIKFIDTRLVTRITCINKSETNVVILQCGKKNPTVRLLLPHLKGFHYSLYLAYYLFFLYEKNKNPNNAQFSLDQITNLICSFAPKNEQYQIAMYLIVSKNKFSKFIDDKNIISEQKLTNYLLKKNKNASNITEVFNNVFTDYFKHLTTVSEKISNLSFMVCQHVRCVLGLRKLDNRDSWANKKIDGAHRNVELILNGSFNLMKTPNGSSFKLEADAKDPITSNFSTVFNANSWGINIKKGKKNDKENIAQACVHGNLLHSDGEQNKIVADVSSRVKTGSVREIHHEQIGAICLVETPESEMCGITKHLAALSILSFNRIYENKIIPLINSLMIDTDYCTNLIFSNKCSKKLYIGNEPVLIDGKQLYISDEFITMFTAEFKTILNEKNITNPANTFITIKNSIINGIEVVKFISKMTEKYDIKSDIRHWSGNIISFNNINELFYEIFKKLFSVVNQYFALEKQINYNYNFSINGDVLINKIGGFYPILIFVSPDLLTDKLKDKRRRGIIPIDSCIYKNTTDFFIQYYDDSGRTMIPYLIVDKDGSLIADKKDLWSKIKQSDYENSSNYIKIFYDEGAIELIDVRESSSILLSPSIEEVRAFFSLRTFLDNYYPVTNISSNINEREYSNYIALIRENFEILFNLPYDKNEGLNYINEHFPFLNENVQDNLIENILENLNIYLKTKFLFTHSFINPNAAFSSGVNVAPLINKQSGPRTAYQAGMEKQSLPPENIFSSREFEPSIKVQLFPTNSSFETIATDPLGLNNSTITQNAIIMIGCHKNNYEDPTILSRSYTEKMMKYIKHDIYRSKTNENKDFIEYFSKPELNVDSKSSQKYENINDEGIPKLGSIIKSGDCIIGKIRKNIETGEKKSICIFAGIGENGQVTSVEKAYSEDGKCIIVSVKISQRRYQIVGDKLAMRYAQKGVIGDIIGNELISVGKIIDDDEMPYIRGGPNHGLKPDIIFNPQGFPSRMTCGMLVEILTSKAVMYTGEKVNATSFKKMNMDYFYNILFENGLDKYGNEFMSHNDGEKMMDSTTGKEYKAFIGIISYQILRHDVVDKIQARNTGKNDPLTRQATKGRSKMGGLRLGEMEYSAIIAHAANEILIERVMKSTDESKTTYCTNCKQISADNVIGSEECYFCKKVGTLSTGVHPRVFLCFVQFMQSMGIFVDLSLEDE